MATDLNDLVEHTQSVPAEMSLETLIDRFRSATVTYVAVLKGDIVVGIVSPESIGRFIGGRYGFALHARDSVTSKMEASFVKCRRSDAILDVLSVALNREGNDFLSDVVLVDGNDRFLGLIPVYRLARLQCSLLEAQRAREAANSAKALSEQKALLQSVLNSMADGVVVADAYGRIHIFNPAAESILRLHLERGAATWHKEYRFFDPETHRRYRLKATPFARAARGETVHGKEVLARHCKTMEEIRLTVNAMPLRFDTDGMCVVVFRDITEQKQTEERLRQSKELAEQADRAKTAFLANMSHEFRTPLNAILGFSEMLVEDLENSPEQLSDVRKIHTAGKHLLSLINGILDLSKIEAGRTQILIERFDFRQDIEEVVCTIEPLARQNSNTLSVSAPETMPVDSDQAKLRQTLLNLLGNACKFTHGGHISLEAELCGVDGETQLEVRIQDTGIGIEPDQLEDLFEPFVQADSSTARKYGGTGLGLAISRRFCRMLGGDLTAASTPGKGSTFFIRVPAGVVQPEVVTVVDDRKRGLALGAADYLTKPVDTDAFQEAIERCVLNEVART